MKSTDPFVILKFIFSLLIFSDIFNVILKDLVENLWVEFFFFSVYPPWIRIKTYADPKH